MICEECNENNHLEWYTYVSMPWLNVLLCGNCSLKPFRQLVNVHSKASLGGLIEQSKENHVPSQYGLEACGYQTCSLTCVEGVK